MPASRTSARPPLLLHPLEDLDTTSPPPGVDLRRGRRREQDEALAVDRAAFEPFGRLEGAGLDGALTATTTVHFQVARDRSGVVGYAVCGRAGPRGYVQRLAVDPSRQGRGIGGGLLVDGVRWVRRGGGRGGAAHTPQGKRTPPRAPPTFRVV